MCGIIALGVILMSACKKTEAEKSTKDKLVGKWKSTYFAIDSIDNDVIDASETSTLSRVITYTFNSDGTATATTSTDTSVGHFLWALTNGDAELRCIFGYTNASGVADTELFRIPTLTDADLTLAFIGTPGATNIQYWVQFKKQ